MPEFLMNLLGAPGVILVVGWLAHEVRSMRASLVELHFRQDVSEVRLTKLEARRVER